MISLPAGLRTASGSLPSSNGRRETPSTLSYIPTITTSLASLPYKSHTPEAVLGLSNSSQRLQDQRGRTYRRCFLGGKNTQLTLERGGFVAADYAGLPAAEIPPSLTRSAFRLSFNPSRYPPREQWKASAGAVSSRLLPQLSSSVALWGCCPDPRGPLASSSIDLGSQTRCPDCHLCYTQHCQPPLPPASPAPARGCGSPLLRCPCWGRRPRRVDS